MGPWRGKSELAGNTRPAPARSRAASPFGRPDAMKNHPDEDSAADHLAAAARLDDAELEGLRARLRPHLPDTEIGACLGRGGMGAVFRARQRGLDRDVAIKVLMPPPDSATGWSERFEREAQALARLQHPNIVGVHGYAQEEGLAWIVMEFVDGASLRELLSDGRLEPAEALALAPQICSALQYAHDAGIVHRDVKPENVLVDARGRVRLVDFGLAKVMGTGDLGLTRSDQAMGTLRYMAPEQLDTPRLVDHRADIFSLGVVLYEMLTGQVPQGVIAPPSRTARIDVRMDEVVLRALEREPERRYQRVGDVGERVEAIRSSEADPTSPAAVDEDAQSRARALERRVGGFFDVALPLAFATAIGVLALQLGPVHGLTLPFGLLTLFHLAVLLAPRIVSGTRWAKRNAALPGFVRVAVGLLNYVLMGLWISVSGGLLARKVTPADPVWTTFEVAMTPVTIILFGITFLWFVAAALGRYRAGPLTAPAGLRRVLRWGLAAGIAWMLFLTLLPWLADGHSPLQFAAAALLAWLLFDAVRPSRHLAGPKREKALAIGVTVSCCVVVLLVQVVLLGGPMDPESAVLAPYQATLAARYVGAFAGILGALLPMWPRATGTVAAADGPQEHSPTA